ncbi:hypothetical protein SEA_RAVENPUFF_44 [Streptomyces phage RavenPuff]|nr:hypothetical protein SEA_RAVENPUFF_44 [Streptomyces phage RavenPuff]UVK63634.1 hypothetical protein SEA_DOXI13_45 [Streptomyces phage Doxi13]
MNTRHGHHIPGTERKAPKFVKRCGGPKSCTQCKAELEKREGK